MLTLVHWSRTEIGRRDRWRGLIRARNSTLDLGDKRMSRTILRLAPVVAALMLGACAGDSPNFFQTASVTQPAVEEARAPKVSSECMALAGQIEALRKEGTIERLEKVAAGKGENVQVKRTAIAKQAELNKANSEFQSKCGPRLPAAQQAAASPMAPATVPAVAGKTAAKATAAAAPSGVTVAPSAARTATPKE